MRGNKLNKQISKLIRDNLFKTTTHKSFFIFFLISIRRRLKDEKIKSSLNLLFQFMRFKGQLYYA